MLAGGQQEPLCDFYFWKKIFENLIEGQKQRKY